MIEKRSIASIMIAISTLLLACTSDSEMPSGVGTTAPSQPKTTIGSHERVMTSDQAHAFLVANIPEMAAIDAKLRASRASRALLSTIAMEEPTEDGGAAGASFADVSGPGGSNATWLAGWASETVVTSGFAVRVHLSTTGSYTQRLEGATYHTRPIGPLSCGDGATEIFKQACHLGTVYTDLECIGVRGQISITSTHSVDWLTTTSQKPPSSDNDACPDMEQTYIGGGGGGPDNCGWYVLQYTIDGYIWLDAGEPFEVCGEGEGEWETLRAPSFTIFGGASSAPHTETIASAVNSKRRMKVLLAGVGVGRAGEAGVALWSTPTNAAQAVILVDTVTADVNAVKRALRAIGSFDKEFGDVDSEMARRRDHATRSRLMVQRGVRPVGNQSDEIFAASALQRMKAAPSSSVEGFGQARVIEWDVDIQTAIRTKRAKKK